MKKKRLIVKIFNYRVQESVFEVYNRENNKRWYHSESDDDIVFVAKPFLGDDG